MLEAINFKVSGKTIPGILVPGIVAFLLLVQSHLWKVTSFKVEVQPLPPLELIEHLSFGYHEIISDTLWIRSVQGFDQCNSNKEVCAQDSWLYKMLDAVTDLSPEFRVPYSTGALVLSVITSDATGAGKLFEKGLKVFPNDWPIAYKAAYHYLYELKDKKRAAELLAQAGRNGAPPWVFSLAGRLYSEESELELALQILTEMKATNQSEDLIKRLEDKIASMQKSK